MTKNIMIVGVGGQGSLLASKLLGWLLLNEGYDVKVSEVHGMSQRGGSVVTYVRFGEKVYSPIIDKGEADLIVSFEKLEAARYLDYLKPDGTVVVNTQQIDPMPVVTGATVYPQDLIEKMKVAGANVDAMDCLTLAREALRRPSIWSFLVAYQDTMTFHLNIGRLRLRHVCQRSFLRSTREPSFWDEIQSWMAKTKQRGKRKCL